MRALRLTDEERSVSRGAGQLPILACKKVELLMNIDKKAVTLFLEALRAAMKNESVNWMDSYPGRIWDGMFFLAEQNMVLPMVFDAVLKSTPMDILKKENPGYFAALQKKASGEVQAQIRRTGALMELYDFLGKSGFHPLIMKGIICRSVYPKPEYRLSSDEDILVPQERAEEAYKLMLDFGMYPVEGYDKITFEEVHVIPFEKEHFPLMVEVHRCPFNPESEVLASWNGFFNEVHDRVIETTVGTDWAGTGDPSAYDRVWTMNPEDQMLFLILHTFKHFLYGGTGVRHITDIILFADRYGSGINWSQIREKCRMVRAEQFLAAVFGIGKHFLEADELEKTIPDDLISDETTAKFLLDDMLDAGMPGHTSLGRVRSSTITLNAMTANAKGGGSTLSYIFLPLNSMKERYGYLEKLPFLLPVAWMQRILHYILHSGARSMTGNRVEDSIRIGHERIRLMEQLGVIREED